MGNRIRYFLILCLIIAIFNATCLKCRVECPKDDESMICGFDIHKRSYTMFPSECAMAGIAQCYKSDYVKTPLKYCVKEHFVNSRRVYGESCPVFCPSHYRPVCAASKYRDYIYRTFTNGCHLDMLNCRGDDDYQDYIEVPLHFCQKHSMKNIFKEQIIVSDKYDFREYNRKK